MGDNWDELPSAASYCDTVETGISDAGGAGGSGAMATVAGPSRMEAAGGASAAVGDCQGSQYNLEQEKQLPGVVMSSQGKDFFSMLYQLALLDEPRFGCLYLCTLVISTINRNNF